MLVATAVFALFSLADIFAVGKDAYLVITVRLVTSAVAAVILLSAIKNEWRQLERIEAIFVVLSGLILHWAGYLALKSGNSDYQSGVILLTLYIGTFSRLSIHLSLAVIVCAVLPYLIFLHPLLMEVDATKEQNHVVIIISTALFCAVGSYRRDFETQARFVEGRQIRSQSRKLASYSRKLKSISETDALTQVNNRHFLNEWIHSIHQTGQPLNRTFIMLDIDHFKAVNDNFGHEAGDLVIRAVADHLKATVPEESLLVRYGGEEFLVVLPSTNTDEVNVWIEALRDFKLSEQIRGYGPLTISAGVYQSTNTADSVMLAIKHADNALYLAKTRGRNRAVFSTAN